MRSLMSFTLAVVMMAIFTFAFGISDANAKTGIMFYGGKSVSPNGALANQTFEGATIGGGIRFGMGHRVSFGLDYMGQKAGGASDHHHGIWASSTIGIAAFEGIDISHLNINPNEEYAYADISESGNSRLITGTFYISLLPKNSVAKKTVEPVIGISMGINALQSATESKAFYHPNMRAVEDLLWEAGFRGDIRYWRFSTPWDDGNDSNGVGAKTELDKYEFCYGPVFALNFYLPGNLVISPEARYLKNYGFIARTGIGFAF